MKKPIKKAQDGESLTQGAKGYTSTKKVATKKGPRYYQGESPNMEFAREISAMKARGVNDSIPKAKLAKETLERLSKKKNGGRTNPKKK